MQAPYAGQGLGEEQKQAAGASIEFRTCRHKPPEALTLPNCRVYKPTFQQTPDKHPLIWEVLTSVKINRLGISGFRNHIEIGS
jgi:hypothetical protein